MATLSIYGCRGVSLPQGSFRVYPLPDDPNIELPTRVLRNLPPSSPEECIVRVYLIKAVDLQPNDPSGLVSLVFVYSPLVYLYIQHYWYVVMVGLGNCHPLNFWFHIWQFYPKQCSTHFNISTTISGLHEEGRRWWLKHWSC